MISWLFLKFDHNWDLLFFFILDELKKLKVSFRRQIITDYDTLISEYP